MILKKMIKEKKALYNYSADQREKNGRLILNLRKVDINVLPDYIKKNKDKYQRMALNFNVCLALF